MLQVIADNLSAYYFFPNTYFTNKLLQSKPVMFY